LKVNCWLVVSYLVYYLLIKELGRIWVIGRHLVKIIVDIHMGHMVMFMVHIRIGDKRLLMQLMVMG